MKYVFWSMSDRGSKGHFEVYESPVDAISAAKEAWSMMTEKEQHDYYLNSPGSYFLAFEAEDFDEDEDVPEVGSILWDAFEQREKE